MSYALSRVWRSRSSYVVLVKPLVPSRLFSRRRWFHPTRGR